MNSDQRTISLVIALCSLVVDLLTHLRYHKKRFLAIGVLRTMPCMRISKWHYVYVLLSKKDDKLYIGYTNNLEKRIKEHNAKRNFSTKGRTPFVLIYAEVCLSEEDSKRRERYLKTTQGNRLLKLRLKVFLKNKEKFI
jgi:putative endonuclease